MSEIEKLYELGNIRPFIDYQPVKDYNFGGDNGYKYKEVKYYPPFTAEKQILLIQWLLDRIDLYLHRHKTDFTYSIASGDIAVNKNKDFKESIAEFINAIWQDLSEEDKQQVKGILE